ncbi:unnamed protein product [Adineta ricciae]|uniref:Uncharacterized protein n=1 Tax=Adineta ricciae TaxID=249248 RepID=A0A814EUN3_ADIRI|nr:unnamed protein product [Adineta ricciae]CAF1652835.1 unnamed protein product [Adineta ricciae]
MGRQSKRATARGDGECNYNQVHHIPIPPTTSTLESYISEFSQRPTNYNRAPIIIWNPRSYQKRLYSISKRQSRHHVSCSLGSKRSSRRHEEKCKSSNSKKNRRVNCYCQTSSDLGYLYSTSNC